MNKKETPEIKFNEKELQLIRYIRSIEYGEISVIVQDRLPIRIIELKKSIKL